MPSAAACDAVAVEPSPAVSVISIAVLTRQRSSAGLRVTTPRRAVLTWLTGHPHSERQPHAKGGGAFGHFEVTQDVSAYTKAAAFQPGTRTDTLIRFSTVAGERGSPDTWRDPRGFPGAGAPGDLADG